MDRVSREEWAALLGEFDDAHIVQTWDFPGCVSPGRRVSRLILRRGDKEVAFAQVRILTLPVVRCGIALVLFGPAWRRKGFPLDPGVFEAALAALQSEYVEKRNLLLRISPYFFGDAREDLVGSLKRLGFKPAPGDRRERTIVVDISRPLPKIRDSMDRNWHRYLKRSESDPSLAVRRGTSPALYEEFTRLYAGMVDRKGLELTVDVERWERLQAVLPEKEKPAVFLVDFQGKAIAGLIVSCLGDTGFPILSASNLLGRKRFASFLMHWKAIIWLQENGCRLYDLVGIDPEGTRAHTISRRDSAGKRSTGSAPSRTAPAGSVPSLSAWANRSCIRSCDSGGRSRGGASRAGETRIETYRLPPSLPFRALSSGKPSFPGAVNAPGGRPGLQGIVSRGPVLPEGVGNPRPRFVPVSSANLRRSCS